MTEYEKSRVRLQIIHIIATLGVPFVVIVLNEYLRGDNDKRRENTKITVECISETRTSRQLVTKPKFSIKKNSKEHD